MIRDEKISIYGTSALLVSIMITKALISTPSLYAKHSHSAGWIEVLASGIFEIVILAIILKLREEYGKKDIVDIVEVSFGSAAMKITAILSAFVFIIGTAAIFRSMEEMVRNTVMRGVSYESVTAFLLVVGIISARKGLKTQISLNGLILPVIIIAVGLILSINYSRLSIENIKPLFGTGFSSVMKNALFKNASFYEMGLILFFTPFLRDNNDVKKIGFTSLTISVIVISIITLLYQLSVPYTSASTFALPLYQMTRMIKSGTFFQRIEPLNLFVWGGVMFVYVGIGIYMSSYMIKKAFNLFDYKPLTIQSGIIIALVSLIPGSETTVEKIFDFLMSYSYFVYPIAPLIILLLAKAFGKSKGSV